MPIFEYICRSCQCEFEEIVQPSTVVECPKCQGNDLEKKLSVFAVGAERGSGNSAEMAPACQGCPSAGMPGKCGMPQ